MTNSEIQENKVIELKKIHLIISVVLVLINVFNFFFKIKFMIYVIFILSVMAIYISLKYKYSYKLLYIDSPTGIWLIEFGIGFNIFEILFNFSSSIIGSIFILLGLLFVLETAIMEKRRKLSDKGF